MYRFRPSRKGLATSEGSGISRNVADSIEQIPLEMSRASHVIKRFGSFFTRSLGEEALLDVDFLTPRLR